MPTATVPFDGREANHLDRQPFGQVPYLDDGDLRIFESGACLLHLAQQSDVLMPQDSAGEAETTQWLFAALNTVEMVAGPWIFLKFSGVADNPLTGWLKKRLDQVERVLASREWLAAGRFTVADLLMADVLRGDLLKEFAGRPATDSYVERITARPAFREARDEQIAEFVKADAARA